jgi:ABC-type multidrug transport system ATPase subunit
VINQTPDDGITVAPAVSKEPPPKPPARLTALADRRIFALEGPGPWILGRGEAADFQFDDPFCSRTQARILRNGDDGFLLEPVSQSTPTLLNGRPCARPVALDNGSLIGFASVRIAVDLAEQDANVTVIGKLPLGHPAKGLAPTRIDLRRGIVLGRSPGGDGVDLDHPTVSRRHAEIQPARTGGGHLLRDLGSGNGTFVNGEAVAATRPLKPGDRIDIGPFSFVYDGTALDGGSRQGKVDLKASDLVVDVRHLKSRQKLRILDRVTLDIQPREFVCIVGASGSGKSTLMGVLSARRPASAGTVTLNGLDLYGNFDALKQDISFVPQSDILHEQLTLRQALDYAAQLRLPADLGHRARAEIVEQAAASVDLTQRLDTRIAALSGGQKKRASLACEILNKPSLLFLDEVTSGLDESTDREIMRLLRGLADSGMTIVCVTHTLVNIEEFCDRAVVMATGGVLVFDGAPRAALEFFGVSRLGQVFDRLAEDGVAEWRGRFERSRSVETVIHPFGQGAVPPHPAAMRELALRGVRQFGILVKRGTRLLLADRRNMAMVALQSLVIGGLIGVAFQNFGKDYQQTPSTVAFLMLLGLAALWLGVNGASKDIVGELPIYLRERDVNLSTAAYILSKFFVTGLFTIIQIAVVLFLATLLADRLPGSFGPQFGVLVLASLLGTAIGLFISSASNTRDQANSIVPLALVPQLILSGSIVPNLPKWVDALAQVFISAHWITEAMIAVAVKADGPLRLFDLAGISRILGSGNPAGLVGLHPLARETSSVIACITLLLMHIIAFIGASYATTLLRYRRRGGA